MKPAAPADRTKGNRREPGTAKPAAESAADQAAKLPCKRCGLILPIDEDGFCDDCRRRLEEACL